MTTMIPKLATLLALSVSITGMSAPLSAQAETVNEALEMVNISARQRMLAQRMAGLSCLVHLDIDAQTHANEALAAQNLFGQSLLNLQSASRASNVSDENKAKIETDISLSLDQFNRMEGFLTSLTTAGTVGPSRLEEIARTSDDLFAVSERLTNHIQSAESENLQSLPLSRTMILNFSGRQRMLSEKAAKDFCLAQAGINTESHLAELAKTITIFDNTMNALINGMPGLIIAPPTPEIKAKLEDARDMWTPVKQVLGRAVAGEVFTAPDIHAATENLESVRMIMNEAVALYEHYNGSSS